MLSFVRVSYGDVAIAPTNAWSYMHDAPNEIPYIHELSPLFPKHYFCCTFRFTMFCFFFIDWNFRLTNNHSVYDCRTFLALKKKMGIYLIFNVLLFYGCIWWDVESVWVIASALRSLLQIINLFQCICSLQQQKRMKIDIDTLIKHKSRISNIF